jgi:hypothetical protein
MTAKFVGHFSLIIPSFTNRGFSCRLEMTGGTTKAVHRGPAAYRPRCDGVVAP